MNLDRSAITDALAPLFERSDLRLMLLFGSVAAGRARAGSDIDLAVLVDGPGFEELRVETMRLLRTERLDVVDLRRAPPVLAMAVVKTGVVLHQRPQSAFARFAALTLRRYEDTAKLRRARTLWLQRFVVAKGGGA
jgi:predicted nucleotidyltransferase